MKRTLAVISILAFILVLCDAANWIPHFKNVQGPPEEFKHHTIPSPEQAAQDSDHASFNVDLKPTTTENGDTIYASELTFPVDADKVEETHFRLNFLTKIASKDLSVFVKYPGDKEWTRLTDQPIIGWFGMSKRSAIPSFTYEWSVPVKGIWSLRMETTQKPQDYTRVDVPTTLSPHVTVLLENDSPYRVMSYLRSYNLKVNEQVGLMARVFDEKQYLQDLARFRGLNVNASRTDVFAGDFDIPLPRPVLPPSDGKFLVEMDVLLPNGKEKRVRMHDDGLHGDNDANDGVYSGSITAEVPGFYFAEVQVRGQTPDGYAFVRTTHHMFNVINEDEDLTFVDNAHGKYDAETQMLTVNIPLRAKFAKSIVGHQFKAYAEVWGTDPANKDVAVAFITGMSIAQASNGDDTSAIVLPLKLHVNWLLRANAAHNGKFKLRNLYVQDVKTSIPIADAQEINLVIDETSQSMLMTAENTPFDGVIIEAMKWGPKPLRYNSKLRRLFIGSNINNGHKLILTHGYCANGAPWKVSDFTDYETFEDYNQNRPNDEFAQLLGARGEQFESFSLVAHSQGGIAALHLLTFYWSGLDVNTKHDDEHRWIQAVGTPFRGTGIASWGDLGKGFGIGCGSNNELTHDGAKLWLSTIPMEARQHVYYYSTQYKDWSWCNIAANAILSWPNDGVSELKYTDFDGGNKVLHKKGYCHTIDMNYPSQCQDSVNNGFMNRKAARQ